MTQSPVKKIAVFGNGMAGLLCVAKLTEILPDNIELTFVESEHTNSTDILFGTVTPPTTYDFLLGLGIQEPDVLLSTNTSFSLGTRYMNWGTDERVWTQSFHRALPAYNGVAFHHYLTRLKSDEPNISEIEAYIMSVQAAWGGVFAHPPEGKNIPLADVEYGYHFLPEDWCVLLSAKISKRPIMHIKADVIHVARSGEQIDTVTLSNGQNIEVDFFVDALGPTSKLTHPEAEKHTSLKALKAVSTFTPYEKLEGVCRVLTATDHGWTSETPLQNGLHQLTVFGADAETVIIDQTGGDHPIYMTIGRLITPWTGNCVSLGHSAAMVEPLTPAPILLLQRDIDRLAELIPVGENMRVESREYNRRFNSDYDYADLFTDAFFVENNKSRSAYWNSPPDNKSSSKLDNKIRQFESRGVIVQHDYEPFSAEDWTMLHFGVGRRPARYDPLANHIPEDQLKNRLSQMRTAIEIMAKKMPPHHIYMSGLKKYLKDKHG